MVPAHLPGPGAIAVTILCENAECSAPESRCKLGLVITTCPHYTTGVTAVDDRGADSAPGDTEAERLPWSADALSLATLSLAFGLRRPQILALIGLPDAGKTSFLITVYDRIRREPLGGRDFAGSMTLRGWEVLNRHLKWQDDVGPTYPPRTSGARREPGFLHLALRGEDDQLIDVLLADTPGEWFRTFARDDNVPGAKISLDLADGLLLAVDPTSLVDHRRHATRQRLTGMIRRVKEHAPTKPLVLVLTRADQAVPEDGAEYREVLDLVQTLYPGHLTYQTISAFEATRSATAGQGVLEAIAGLLTRLEEPQPAAPVLITREPLLARLIGGGR